MICTLLPPLSGFTKIVSSASPRFRLSIEEAGVIRSLPCLVQPCALSSRPIRRKCFSHSLCS